MSRHETLLVLAIVVVMGGIVYIYVGFREYIMQICISHNYICLIFNLQDYVGLGASQVTEL